MSHVWRIPGTANWPNRKKVHERNRPREPQPVRIIKPWDGSLTSAEELRGVLASYMSDAKPNDTVLLDEAANGKISDYVTKLMSSVPGPEINRSEVFAHAVKWAVENGMTIGARSASTTIVDGKGRTLMPGLIDAHVHMTFSTVPLALISYMRTFLKKENQRKRD